MTLAEYIRARVRLRPVYMPYLTVGDPSFKETPALAIAMIDEGADIIELGIPFSDPTADGPVIQAAMVRSMKQPDFSLPAIFEAARQIHTARPDVPLVLLTYLNPVMNGFAAPTPEERLRRFVDACERSGVMGLVIPDLPFEAPESEMLFAACRGTNVGQVGMVAPNTSPKRIRRMKRHASGFVYYVTSYGVTGERSEMPEGLSQKVEEVRELSGLPVLAGFGISKPEHVESLANLDGVIVGSLNHRIISENPAGATDALARTTKGFVDALAKLGHPAHPSPAR
ncbi:MAG: tryptophan synthase subunit alpha [Spirochaetia bacterium]|nr:tryptophan synthase subunit alpha [Spirochaetia bacterium]